MILIIYCNVKFTFGWPNNDDVKFIFIFNLINDLYLCFHCMNASIFELLRKFVNAKMIRGTCHRNNT